MDLKKLTVDQLIQRNAELKEVIATLHAIADEHLKRMIPLVNERIAVNTEIARRAHVTKNPSEL